MFCILFSMSESRSDDVSGMPVRGALGRPAAIRLPSSSPALAFIAVDWERTDSEIHAGMSLGSLRGIGFEGAGVWLKGRCDNHPSKQDQHNTMEQIHHTYWHNRRIVLEAFWVFCSVSLICAGINIKKTIIKYIHSKLHLHSVFGCLLVVSPRLGGSIQRTVRQAHRAAW